LGDDWPFPSNGTLADIGVINLCLQSAPLGEVEVSLNVHLGKNAYLCESINKSSIAKLCKDFEKCEYCLLQNNISNEIDIHNQRILKD
jgi:hypothetical protein